ncbi:MAG TPA: Asp-tRNA(Asn)/Glu-tRNA(Gln) amidotransferase subunit GatC [Patescibacteria group bacterium]|nr:Asp-tRNA(Asn)/Glu-tRNA(Gln) amidotransferase subunit GatC [Patescibacteria group bacterium]
MAITKQSIEYVAHLSRIDLSPEELEKFSGQLAQIVAFIDKLKQLDVEHVSPTSHILPIQNVLRQDVPGQSLPVAQVLADAPKQQDNLFAVPKIID